MYAVIELGGRQWKVEPGTRLDVNRLPVEVGAQHAVDRVLLAHDGRQARVGRPYVPGAAVVCEVLEHRLGPKVISYYFRRRENWRKTIGHRQPLTRLLVKDVRFDGVPAAAEEPAAPAAKKDKAPPRPRAPKPSAAAKKRPAAKETKQTGTG